MAPRLRPDNKANEKLYGMKVSAKTIVLENVVPMPASADELISTLNEHGQKAPKEKTGETSASSQR
jgi:lipid-binding SYLF domain-containing protein